MHPTWGQWATKKDCHLQVLGVVHAIPVNCSERCMQARCSRKQLLQGFFVIIYGSNECKICNFQLYKFYYSFWKFLIQLLKSVKNGLDPSAVSRVVKIWIIRQTLFNKHSIHTRSSTCRTSQVAERHNICHMSASCHYILTLDSVHQPGSNIDPTYINDIAMTGHLQTSFIHWIEQ